MLKLFSSLRFWLAVFFLLEQMGMIGEFLTCSFRLRHSLVCVPLAIFCLL